MLLNSILFSLISSAVTTWLKRDMSRLFNRTAITALICVYIVATVLSVTKFYFSIGIHGGLLRISNIGLIELQLALALNYFFL